MPTFLLPAQPTRRTPPVPITDVSGEDIALKSTYTIAGGDYVTVRGDAAAEQSVRREHMANVGALARRPYWGVGLPALLFRAATRSSRDTLVARSRRRLAANPRVARVDLVEAFDLDDTAGVSGTGLRVRYIPAGRQRPVEIIIRSSR